MIYEIGMLCKHFNGTDIDGSLITYTGDGELRTATNLVVYSNIFQDNKLFCREYEDISGEISDEKKAMFNQTIKVQPLTDEEISIINSEEFIENKKELVAKKFSKKM